MKNLTLVVMCLLLIGCGGPWTRTNTALELGYLATNFMDYRQTSYISGHPGEFKEMNRVTMSIHPSQGEVNRNFLASAILHPIISWMLPSPWREWWQGGTLATSGAVVIHNKSIGVGME